jgi:hypothetical protein
MQSEHEEHETYAAINRVATMLYIERRAALFTLLFSALMLLDVHSIKLCVGSFIVLWSLSFWMTRTDARMPKIILKSFFQASILCPFEHK